MIEGILNFIDDRRGRSAGEWCTSTMTLESPSASLPSKDRPNLYPILPICRQLRFKELWRHVEMLDLPELNPAMQVDTPTFDPALFFQRLRY